MSIALLIACQGTQSVALGTIALFLPEMRDDLHMSYSQAGSLSAIAVLVYAVVGVPVGFLADRLDARRLFVYGLVGTHLAVLALATTSSYTTALPTQALSGALRALLFVPGLLLITSLFPAERRATAMSVYVAGGVTGNVLLNAFGAAAGPWLGWRMFLVVAALSSLLLTAVYWRMGAPAPGTPEPSARTPWRATLRTLRRPVMWLLACIQYVRYALALGVATWLPTYILVDLHHPVGVAGLALALSGIATVPANLLGGIIADRLMIPVGVIAVSLGALAVTTALLTTVTSVGAILTVAVLNGFFVQLYFGPLFALPVEFMGAESMGLASGIGNLFANLGGFTVVIILGAIRDATGSLVGGFHLLAALALVGLACAIAVGRIRAKAPVADDVRPLPLTDTEH